MHLGTYVNEEGKDIEEKEHLKDLGIQLSDDLTFNKHIDKTIESMSKVMNSI